MRILSAFFAVLFTFINPCMLYKVVTELESSLSHPLPDKMRIRLLESICSYFVSNNLMTKLRLAVYVSVLLFTLLHLILTGLSLYGHYSCRPAFIRPSLLNAAFSFIVLLLFICYAVLMYWHLSSNGFVEEKEFMKTHLRNIYIGAAFLVSYLAWIVVSIAAYVDTKKLHADFMYWIVEEKMSMRSKANASSDLRSERSSKGSKASRTSNRSNRSCRSAHSVASDRPRLITTNSDTVVSSRASAVDVRMSVPL